MVFTSANCLDLPCPSEFSIWYGYFPTMLQDPLVNLCHLFFGDILNAHFQYFWTAKCSCSRPLCGQYITLHVAAVTWCAEETLPLNIQPSTRSCGARRNCTSLLWHLKGLHGMGHLKEPTFTLNMVSQSGELLSGGGSGCWALWQVPCCGFHCAGDR